MKLQGQGALVSGGASGHELPKEAQESLGASIPCPKRLGKPDEFARRVLHMIDNLSRNGAVVRLDGALRQPPRRLRTYT